MVFNLQLKIPALLSLLIFGLLSGCNTEVGAGQTAPDFALEDLSGKSVSLKQYAGNIVLLDFWATWCPPCRQSIPELIKLQDKYRDQGLVILGISLDDPRQFDNRYLLAFKEKFKINYRILRADNKVPYDYFGNSNMAIPTLFVINRNGKVVDMHVGFRPGVVEKSLKKLM